MPKYYYNDHIQAAYMAKHFNMKIYVGELVANNIWDYENCALHISNEAGKYYIHPESLHLLEPQIGDIVKMIYLDDSVGYIEWEEHDNTYEGQIFSGRDLTKTTKIIQRNNKPFFWPEIKEIEHDEFHQVKVTKKDGSTCERAYSAKSPEDALDMAREGFGDDVLTVKIVE